MEVPGFGIGYRHLISMLMFLGVLISYALRINISVAIVAMIDNSTDTQIKTYPEYSPQKDVVLSSFFWGYVVLQIPAAEIGRRFGPHYPLGIAILLCSITALLTPFIAEFGVTALIATRVIHGLTQGFLYPSIHNLCSKWIPKLEQARLVTFIYAGCLLGTVISLQVSGLLSGTPSLGWPSIFYTHGAVGILWSVLWLMFGSNTPAEHPRISSEEQKYIEASFSDDLASPSRKIPTPWGPIFKSLPMWALTIVNCGHNWGFWTLLTEMPSFMKQVLDFDFTKMGFLSSLPFLMMWLLSFVFSFISDYITNRNLLPISTCRKLANTIGLWTPAAALLALTIFITPDRPYLAITFFTIAVGSNAAVFVGLQLNHIDLAPNHAGVTMGITNCLSNFVSIIAPLTVGIIVDENSTEKEWNIVFYIAIGVYFFGNLFFLLFASADIQPWNDLSKNSDLELNVDTKPDVHPIDNKCKENPAYDHDNNVKY
ncbi:putative inorganic phosphate cotransporter isoform X2 [Chrysoperla carnea]|uniref:putative inorganic phosphate cotransporter isoform X2 n=1 Tax=Chrysoperla carnea TaxID=189513 RepID=UPI001D081875|nr:putative inorganic phosphate cotransporter isoform X2 [Chrysoperla carnea]